MDKPKFKVGDRVYLPYHYGTITAIYNDGRLFPIEVTWDELVYGEKYIATYDADGYSMEGAQDGVPELAVVEMTPEKGEKEMKDTVTLNVGDTVYSHHFGYGVVVDTDEMKSPVYPIKVDWERGEEVSWYGCSYFTKEGKFKKDTIDPEYDIELLKKGEEKMENDMKKGLKIGDWVWLNPNEKGIITFIYPNKETCIVDSELDGEVEAVMAGLTKVEYSPINPSHYQVKGIPEAIDIMKHLMTQEQFKGFLWGNIIKYAYRYGRKGDEHDTAGKIEWYANRLKEVCAEEKKEQERE